MAGGSNQGELLFERYLAEQGYAFVCEPDLGVDKRPDFLVTREASEAVCEVKSFDDHSVPASQATSYRTIEEVLRPVRNQIRRAATQLKPLADRGWPLVVVLTNPLRARVPLNPVEVMSAMYGDLMAIGLLHPDGSASDFEQIADRNGKLTTQHPYVSAVAVVRQRFHADAWADEWFEQHRDTLPGLGDRLGEFLAAAADAPTGDDVALDVFETVSASATPLPADWFRGPNDRRWRPTSDGAALMLDRT